MNKIIDLNGDTFTNGIISPQLWDSNPEWDCKKCWPNSQSNNVELVVVATNQNSLSLLRQPELSGKRIYLRASEFITSDGKRVTKLFKKVAAKGGFNRYLDIDNPVVLCFIMHDRSCSGITPNIAAELINGIKPYACTTLDESTYLREDKWSEIRLSILQRKNRALIRKHPDMKFIGVVKGCNQKQIEAHTMELLSLGIQEFIFHAGDYIAKGSYSEIKTARDYALSVRKMVPTLYAFGIGSKQMINRFYFVDGIITLNPIIETHHGIITDASGRITQNRKYVPNQKVLSDYFKTNHSSCKISDTDILNSYLRICNDFADRNSCSLIQTEIIDSAERASIMLRSPLICLKCTEREKGCC